MNPTPPPRELLLDSHLSRKLCRWVRETMGLPCVHVSDLGKRNAEDGSLFTIARQRNSILVSKDSDFIDLLNLHGPPPHLIYVTCGNTHNSALRLILEARLRPAIAAIESGEPMVEIGSA